MKKTKKDIPQVGILLGLLLPLVGLGVFSLAVIHRFDSFKQMIEHFQLFGMWYKVLTLSMMPNVGLFFLWTKLNKMNQARSILLMTLFYGIFVIILFL